MSHSVVQLKYRVLPTYRPPNVEHSTITNSEASLRLLAANLEIELRINKFVMVTLDPSPLSNTLGF